MQLQSQMTVWHSKGDSSPQIVGFLKSLVHASSFRLERTPHQCHEGPHDSHIARQGGDLDRFDGINFGLS